MNKKWTPVSGTFYCPGKMSISVDEMGITIGTGNRALATTEWPGGIRLCELVEEPDTATQIPEQHLETIIAALRTVKSDIEEQSTGHPLETEEITSIDATLTWLDKIEKDKE